MGTLKTAGKIAKGPQQTPINAVPLSSELRADADRFLAGAKAEGAIALAIVFRSVGNGTVDANVLSKGLTEETRDKMANAALKSISGQPLFYMY